MSALLPENDTNWLNGSRRHRILDTSSDAAFGHIALAMDQIELRLFARQVAGLKWVERAINLVSRPATVAARKDLHRPQRAATLRRRQPACQSDPCGPWLAFFV